MTAKKKTGFLKSSKQTDTSDTESSLAGWGPSLLGWRPSLLDVLGWCPLLFGWKPLLAGWLNGSKGSKISNMQVCYSAALWFVFLGFTPSYIVR